MSATQQSQWNVNLQGMVPVNVSGIPDAPSDGERYVRKDAAWVATDDEQVVQRGEIVEGTVADWDAVTWDAVNDRWAKASASDRSTLAQGIAVGVASGTANIVSSGLVNGAHPYGAAAGPRYLSTAAGALVEDPPAAPNNIQFVLAVQDTDRVAVNVAGNVFETVGDAPVDGSGYVRKDGAWEAAAIQSSPVGLAQGGTGQTTAQAGRNALGVKADWDDTKYRYVGLRNETANPDLGNGIDPNNILDTGGVPRGMSYTTILGGGSNTTSCNIIGSGTHRTKFSTDFPTQDNGQRGLQDSNIAVADESTLTAATIGGGYDHLNNQIAGVICGGGHNELRYENLQSTGKEGSHGIIGGGSENIIYGGRYSAIVGGTGNRMRGNYNTLAAGTLNKIGVWDIGAVPGDPGLSNDCSYSIVLGGYANIIGTESTRADNVIAANGSSILGGKSNTIRGNSEGCTIIGGWENQVDHLASTARFISAGGYRARGLTYGSRAYASGYFAAAGDAQHEITTWRRSIAGPWTGASTATRLSCDGTGAFPMETIPNSVYAGRAMVVVSNSTKQAAFEITFLAVKGAEADQVTFIQDTQVIHRAADWATAGLTAEMHSHNLASPTRYAIGIRLSSSGQIAENIKATAILSTMIVPST